MSVYEKAIIYCRVSSERQVNEGHGLDSQEQRCLRRAQEMGLVVTATFRDEGISGGLFERPAMKQLLTFLDKHSSEKFVVIFDDLKRFARDVEVHLKLRTELVSRGASLHCLNFNFDESPEGRFVETVIAATSQLDREQNKRQVIQKMKARLESGYWCFFPPPGMTNGKSPSLGRILVPNQPFASIYKQAIEKYCDYELNTLDEVQSFISHQYSIHNIRRKISLHGVTNILTNPLYAGYLAYKPWNIPLKKAVHQGFITYKTYQIVQAKLSEKAKPRIRKDINEEFPLRGFVLCKRCSKAFTSSCSKGRSAYYYYYWCKTKGCSHIVARDNMEKDFENLLKEIQLTKKRFELAKAVLLDILKNKEKDGEIYQKSYSSQVEQIEQKIAVYTERIASATSEVLIKQYEKELEILLGKKKEAEQKALLTREQIESGGTAIEVVMNYLENPLNMWKNGSYKDKKLLLNIYFENRVSYDKNSGFGTADLPLILSIFRQKGTSKKALVDTALKKWNRIVSWLHEKYHQSLIIDAECRIKK